MNTIEQPDLVRREISENDLPKKAIAILRKMDRLVAYYNQLPHPPADLSLFRDDYRYLAEHVKNINQLTYRGYGFKKYG